MMSRKLQVLFLASEWGSSKGGLSTISRELAINVAEHSAEVDVSYFVPKCSDEDRNAALDHKINLVQAKKRVGMDELQWLNFPPQDLRIDVVVGHGVKLGPQAAILKDNRNCKWVQVVHTAPEELAMHKNYPNPLSSGEKKHEIEVELCKLADFVVSIGPKLNEAFRSYLCLKDESVFNFTPGIFREFSDVQQVYDRTGKFRVLLFGRGDAEDFNLKGCDIAAKAVALSKTHLIFVGAPEEKLEEVKSRFLECGIHSNNLTVRRFLQNREDMKDLLREADVAIMPSRTEGFGLTGLEALSAGLPILVSKNSGFAEALSEVMFGSYFVVDSDIPEVWATAIKNVMDKKRRKRLGESEALRISYEKEYSWEKQSKELIAKMISMVCECSGKTEQRASQQTGISTEHLPGTLRVVVQFDSVTFQNGLRGDSKQVMDEMTKHFFKTKAADIPAKELPRCLHYYLEGVLDLKEKLAEEGSLIITVECRTLEILERLWDDYCSGHLNAVAEECLLTDDIKIRFQVDSVKLKTTILVEDYLACKCFLTSVLARSHDSSTEEDEMLPQHRIRPPAHDETQTQSPEELEPTTLHLAVNYEDILPDFQRVQQEENWQELVSEDVLGAEATDTSSEELPQYLQNIKVIHGSRPTEESENRVELAVECENLEMLERLWHDYCSGHLNAVAKKCFLTDDIKRRFQVKSVNLHTIILEEDYLACKEFLLKKSREQGSSVKEQAPLPEEIQFEVRPEKSVEESSEACPDQSLVKSTTLYHKAGEQGFSVKEQASLSEAIQFEALPEKRVEASIDESSEDCPDQSLVKSITLYHKGEVSSSDLSSENSELDQGDNARWIDTSFDFLKDKKQENLSWMARFEKAKASRGALHKASISGQDETVKMLLESGEDVEPKDEFSLTPLHLACWYGQESVVKLLLKHGANINALDRFQCTPLQKAERRGHQSIVQLLLKGNASPSYQQPLNLKSLAQKAFLHVDRRSGFNLLQAAVVKGDYNVFSYASALLNTFVKEMTFETTGINAKLFPRKTAVDILVSLEEKGSGHTKMDKLNLEEVKKESTLTELHRCRYGDDAEKAIELVLSEDVDINIPELANCTPLLWASLSCSSMFIKTLIDLGADVNAQRTDDKATPLHLAASWNRYMASRLLLEHGADANIQDSNGDAPLHISVRKGFIKLSQLLIEAGCKVNLQNNGGRTPLFDAGEKGHENLGKLLLENNADVNVQNILGYTPLFLSVKCGNKTFVKLLLKNNADINIKNHFEDSPLQWSVRHGHENLVKLLLENDPDVNIQDNDGNTPLHLSVKNNRSSLVKLLLENKADVNIQDNDGYTPLHLSVKNVRGDTLLRLSLKNNRESLVKLFLENDPDVNIQDNDGRTPLHLSVEYGLENLVKLLLENDPDVNIQDNDGDTPLHLSVKNNLANLVKLLLENKADVNIQAKDGRTPLHLSVKNNRANLVKLLLENKADVNIQDNDGYTPLHLSAKESRSNLPKVVLENKADLNVQPKDGFTCTGS